MARSTTCLLCGVTLEPIGEGLQKHPDAPDCEVRFTDLWGVAVPFEPEVEREAEPEEPDALDIKIYPFVDEVLAAIYDKVGVQRLGGISSGRGWSSVSQFQRCPYAWNRCYRQQKKPWFLAESPSLAIGSLIHTFLAHHYWPVDAIADLPPETMRDLLRKAANPEFVDEAWRVFSAYRMFYSNEIIQPLAIEYDLKDPRSGESCRFDMIAYFPEANVFEREPGTYIMEHKCLVGSSRIFDPMTGRLTLIEGRAPAYVPALDAHGRIAPAIAGAAESNGLDEIFKLTTDHGRVLVGNAKHPILTLDGWRALGELTPNDWVAVPRRLVAPEAIASHRDEEVGLLGYLLGDGYLGDSVSFAKNHDGVRTRVSELASTLGWPHAQREYKAHAKKIDFLGSRVEGVYAFLDTIGLRGCTAEQKHVPHESLTLQDRQVALLLAGLFDTDGGIDTFIENGYPKPRIAYVSRSRELAFDVMFLFDRLGVESTCRASSVAYKDERREVWTVKIIGRASKRRFLSMILSGDVPAVRLGDAAKIALDALAEIDDELVPCAWVRREYSLDVLDARLRLRVRSHRTIGLGYLREFNEEAAARYHAQAVRWERVETLLACGRAEVFNIEVPGLHTFVANGIVTHNSLSRFDDDNLEGWVNDGEVIGQVALWKRLGLDLRFGPLKGVIMNLLGKHKEPRFHRTTISPQSWQIEAHLDDLKRWEGLIQLACSSNSFPRSRQGCLTRWGRCQYFDHCATGEDG